MEAPARAPGARVRLAREAALARTLLVQACEESDPGARFVPRSEREAASREVRRVLGEGAGNAAAERFVVERARRLSRALVKRHPALRTALAGVKLHLSSLPVLTGAAAAGLAADALGGERSVNLLTFPLLGLLAWNAAIYLGLALAPFVGRRARATGAASAMVRGVAWLAQRRAAGVAPESMRWLAASLRRFAALWSAQAGALVAARVRRLLHLGALGLALGVVAGMYLRGLAFEYRASWESTFLGAPAVSRLLGAVLGPAARVLDHLEPTMEPSARELLDTESLAGLRAPAGDGPAAPWIHLWALTAGAAIGVPRAALAWREGRRAARLAAKLRVPLDAPYYLRLRAPDRGKGLRIAVWPYSHRLSPRATDALLELLHELFGNRAQLKIADPLPYGAEAPREALRAGAHGMVVIFNLAQSPEQEVHGAFLEALRPHGDDGEGGPGTPALLVLLDEEPYRERLGESGGHDRLGQRRRAWERLASASDLRFAALRPLEGAGADETLAQARAALGASAPEAAA